MKVVFFSVLSPTPTFLSRPFSHINNSQKNLSTLRRGYTVKYFFQTTYFMKCVFHDSFSLCKLPKNVHHILFETFWEYKNSENRFSEFSPSWKTLLVNLFPWLINPFVINGVYKSLKENVSITWKASKGVFVFWEAVVQRCSIKKVFKKEILAQVFSFFIKHLWWLLLYFIL